MARETKVGLIAGLAFIVCFAAILANRGRPVPTPQQPRFQYVQSEANTRTASDAPATNRRDTLADRIAGVSRDMPAVDQRRQTGLPAAVNDQYTANHAYDDGHRSIRTATRLPSSLEGSGGWQGRQESSTVTDAHTIDEGSDEADRFHQLEQRLAELSRELALQGQRNNQLVDPTIGKTKTEPGTSELQAQPESSDVEVVGSAPVGAGDIGHHVVLAGDTLSKIAAIHYGSKSRRLIDALFDANRAVISKPNVLRIGMELVLPIVTGHKLTNSGTSVQVKIPNKNEALKKSPRGKTPAGQHTGGSRPFRWYQIKKNDRYVSIARQQLGDAARWSEIFELNKHTFPDPSRIRAGVRIKLPAVRRTQHEDRMLDSSDG